MLAEKIRSMFQSAVSSVTQNLTDFVRNPGKDFTRNRKLSADKVLTFLIAEGSSATKNEMIDFFGTIPERPGDSALNQQRAKLRPEAVKAVFDNFNEQTGALSGISKYRFLAADGTTATYFSSPDFSSPEYFVEPCHSAKGYYSIHINAFYDLDAHIYTDALFQPIHEKDEFRAFCAMVDRHPIRENTRNVYIGDRGYCSYNNMVHVIESGQYFLFRTKDIHSKGLVGNFGFPEEDSFDIRVSVTLTRSNSKKISVTDGYRRFIDKASSFDYIEYGSLDTYSLSFRIVRFPLSDNTYECIVTNLPEDEFPIEEIKKLYYRRWGIETSFRKLKYTIGLSNFHAYKSEYVMQEIWARLTAYNVTETIISHTALPEKERKHTYKINFSVAAHICRMFLRPSTEEHKVDVTALLQKELIPVRNDRKYPRLKTAHFRKPRYFIYRAA